MLEVHVCLLLFIVNDDHAKAVTRLAVTGIVSCNPLLWARAVDMDNAAICYMTMLEMSRAVKEKKISPVKLVDAVLQRIDRLNPRVNVCCALMAEAARQKALAAGSAVIQGAEVQKGLIKWHARESAVMQGAEIGSLQS